MSSALIFGCGYLGERAARLWSQNGKRIFAVTRSTKRADEFRQIGWEPIVADVTQPKTLQELPAAETVLFAVGFDRTSGHAIEDVYVDGLAAVCERVTAATECFIYISSTGVYGQTGGEWVDEAAACDPIRRGGLACLAAERLLQKHELGSKSLVLRLAGIYGPGRVPRKSDILNKSPLAVPDQSFLNLMHVDDAARAVVVAAKSAQLPNLYLVADGHPVGRREYYQEIARLAGVGELQFTLPDTKSTVADRSRSNKRIRNDKFLADFDFCFDYPSYREGLRSIWNEE